MLKELPYTVGDQDLIDERWKWNRIGQVMIGVMIKWDDEKFDKFFNAIKPQLPPDEIEEILNRRAWYTSCNDIVKPHGQMSFTFLPK
tara:strand:- start:12 stop:272 length:261 start_codon:yes stop_codon:yes gene_type:complete